MIRESWFVLELFTHSTTSCSCSEMTLTHIHVRDLSEKCPNTFNNTAYISQSFFNMKIFLYNNVILIIYYFIQILLNEYIIVRIKNIGKKWSAFKIFLRLWKVFCTSKVQETLATVGRVLPTKVWMIGKI